MLLKRLAIAALFLAMPCYAQSVFILSPQWDVRTTGSDTNGGAFDPVVAIPGADYSQQNSPQVTYTDLVIGSTTTHVTSVLNPFATCTAGVGYCGNFIHITGGTGCTTGWYDVLSTSTITATLDRSAGSAASTCTGKLGGSMATPAAVEAVRSADSVVNIKNGTYTTTSIIIMTLSGSWVGYNSTHGDITGACSVVGCPIVTTSTSSIACVIATGTGSGTFLLRSIESDDTTGTNANFCNNGGGSGTQIMVASNSFLTGGAEGINVGSAGASTHVFIDSSELSHTGSGLNTGNTLYAGWVTHANFHDNNHDIQMGSVGVEPFTLTYSILANSTNGTYGSVIVGYGIVVDHNTFVGCAGNCLDLSMNAGGQPASYGQVTNNIFALSGAGGIEHQPVNYPGMNVAMCGNAFYGNTVPNAVPYLNPTNINPSVNPFVNSSAGNYALNSTSGGGALLQGTACTASFGSTTTTGEDVGAVQRAGGVTVTTGNYIGTN